MITLNELNPKNFVVSPEIADNLNRLFVAMNLVRAAYAKPMIVTSGLRDLEDHKRIYKELGIPEDKIPMGSQHLHGNACDIADKDGALMIWCKANETFLKHVGIKGIELGTNGWVHFQIVPVKSGNFWFNA